MDRNETIKKIRTALKKRSPLAWSVRGGRGTSYGWITISCPPKRETEYGSMTAQDAERLAKLLGLENVHHQGVQIPASTDYRIEYIDRAEGRNPSRIGKPYWD